MQPSYISTFKVLASEGSRERGVKLQYMDGKKLAKFLHFDLILRILDMVKGQIFGFFWGWALNMEMYATCPPLSGLFHQKAAAGPGQKCAPAVLMPPRPAPPRLAAWCGPALSPVTVTVSGSVTMTWLVTPSPNLVTPSPRTPQTITKK